jgi:hypothetical protein
MAGTATSRAIAMWDGTAWSGMGGGVDGGLFPSVNSIAVSGSSVYVSGIFLKAGSISAMNIARWDGTAWQTLGSGTDGQIRASAISGTSLYVGGDFDMAGMKPSYKFGEWRGVPNIIAPGGGEDRGAPSIALLGGSPNPTTDAALISFSIDEPSVRGDEEIATAASSQVRVTVHDALGRVVATLLDASIAPGDHSVMWDATGLSEGVYLCRIECNGRSESGTIVLQR